MDRPAIEFNEERHEYRLDGAVVPSVTEVIKPLVDFSRVPEEQLEYKRQIGKALDTAITLYERQDLEVASMDDAVMPFFEAWLAFKKDTGFRVLLNQAIVYSRKLRFAGTLDLLGTRVPDSASPDELIDTKCVWAMGRATAVQTAAYSLATLESLGIRLKKRGAVQLLQDGTYRYHPYTHSNDENVFKALLAIHAWKGLPK